MLISMRRYGQLAFDLRYKGRGGPRKGAGRPRNRPGTVPHLPRPSLSAHHPVHVTLRLVAGLESLRSRQCYRVVLPALSRGMQGLAIRVAKALNAAVGRSGKVFAERFHMHVLRAVREVANAVDYVLSNWFRHAGKAVGIDDIDRLSSAADPSLVVEPRTWLLRVGTWRFGPSG